MENVYVLYDSESRERLGNFETTSKDLVIHFMTSGYEVYPMEHAYRKELWELRIMYDVHVDGWDEEEWVN